MSASKVSGKFNFCSHQPNKTRTLNRAKRNFTDMTHYIKNADLIKLNSSSGYKDTFLSLISTGM